MSPHEIPVRQYTRRHKSPEIRRFGGIKVPGWTGPRPGGGMYGATPELDEAISEAAILLADRYGRDVQIRFNADRQSGGAYSVLPSGIEIGISAKLSTTPGRLHYGATVHPPGKSLQYMESRVDTVNEALWWLETKIRRPIKIRQAEL